MRQQGQYEFGDMDITANRWSRQVPTDLRPQLEYLRVYREAIEEDTIYNSIFKNTTTKLITVDGYDATQLRRFLLRPFDYEDRSIPLDQRMRGVKTKGYVLINAALGRLGFFYQGYARYNFDIPSSIPETIPDAERLNKVPAGYDELWAFVERTYPVQAAAALIAVRENDRRLTQQARQQRLPPQAPAGK